MNAIPFRMVIPFIKQFVVTNCSKERPGSIVNETLKNRILILIDTTKGSIPPKSHKIWTKITPSHSVYQRTLQKKFQAYIYKNVEFCIFCQKTDHGCEFCFPGVIVSTNRSRNVARGLILMGMKSSSALFKWPKNWIAPRPPPTLIFSKSTDRNFVIVILFRIVENNNNYVITILLTIITNYFGDDLLPHSPWGRGCKLQTLTSVYIQ